MRKPIEQREQRCELAHNLCRVVAFDDGQNAEEGKASAALKIARGKYFRTVDADDWVDTAALASFVKTLRTFDADCFVTRYVVHDNNKKTTKVFFGGKTINTTYPPVFWTKNAK